MYPVKFLILSLCSVLWSCAGLTHYQPTGLMEIPEITDTDPGSSFDFGTIPSVEYSATKDPSYRTFSFDPKAQSGSSHFARMRFPMKRDDLELAAGIYSTAGLFGSVKYQFFGPKLSHGKIGDNSLAAVVSGNITATSIKTGSGRGDMSGGFPWESKISGNQAGAGLLYGWRFRNDLLFYGGPYGSYSNIQADVNQAAATDGSHSGGDYRLIDYFFRYGPTFGTFFSAGKFAFQLEAAYLFSKVGQKAVTLNPTTSFSIAIRYDDFRPKPEKYY